MSVCKDARLNRRSGAEKFPSGAKLAAALLLAFGGCGQQSKLHQVSGAVTVDGAPLEDGSISFTPLDGQGPTAGTTIRGGQYRIEMPPGKKRVTIEAYRDGAAKRTDSYPGMADRPAKVQFLPARYNSQSTLDADVTANAEPVNFDLESK